MNTLRKKKLNLNIWAVILLTVGIFTAYLCTFAKISGLLRESCFNRLEQSVIQLVWELNSQVGMDTEKLENIAGILEEFELTDQENVQKILQSCHWNGLMTQVGILYPDNYVMWADGKVQDASLELSFDEIVSRGGYISRKSKSIVEPEGVVIRNFVPVTCRGKVVAVLFGEVDLQDLPNSYTVNVYDGNAQMYLIEGESGEYILDTWHKTLGNTRDYGDRKAKSGCGPEEFREAMKNGDSGRLIFESQSAGEDFYGFYMSVGINDWRMQVTVPESVAFEDMKNIKGIFLVLVILLFVMCGVFLTYSLRVIRKDAIEKEKRLGQVQYMFEVEKLLFDAHRFPDKMEEALGRIGYAAAADMAFFIVLEDDKVARCHMWAANGQKAELFSTGLSLEKMIPYCYKTLRQGKSVVWNQISHLKEVYPEDYAFWSRHKRIMVAPVCDGDGIITGILGTVDMKYSCEDAGMLECVTLSFSMALNNLKSYCTIKEMGLMDYNTGLQNRNSYHRDLQNYEKEQYKTLACIYVDVNGLHEVNNCLGHAAGDEMLREIASIFRYLFGESNTYRIGGDEFVAVCADQPQETVRELTRQMNEAVRAKGYHISIGVSWRDSQIRIGEMIQDAEKNMYEEKHRYYQGQGNIRKAREMNRRLEVVLTQKRDSEAFLSVLSSQFLGVYVVDLLSDKVRYIFIPEYFQDMLNESGGKFSKAQSLYEEKIVLPECREAYHLFQDYDNLRKQLAKNNSIELIYSKKDGSRAILRVYRNGVFTQELEETLWVYESGGVDNGEWAES